MLNTTDYKIGLNESIESAIKEIGKADLGTEQGKILVDNVTKLIDRSIEIKKLEQDSIDRDVRIVKDEKEQELKMMEIEARKFDKKLEQFTKVVLFIGSAAVMICGTVYTTNFEKDDNYSYSASKEFAKGVINFFKGKF